MEMGQPRKSYGLVFRKAMMLSISDAENLPAKDGMGGFAVGIPSVTT